MTVRCHVRGSLGAGVHADPSEGDLGMMQQQGLPQKGDAPVPGCLWESSEAASCLLHLLWALPLPGEGRAPAPRGESEVDELPVLGGREGRQLTPRLDPAVGVECSQEAWGMSGSTPRPEGPWQSPPLKSSPFVRCAGRAHSQVGSCTRLGRGHTCMPLSDADLTCTPRREGLRRVRRRVAIPVVHTRGTRVYTHTQHMHTHPHTCVHTVLVCTHIHPCAQTQITKSRSSAGRRN